MTEIYLYEQLEFYKSVTDLITEIPDIIKTGLAPKISLREYQKSALINFILYFENEKLNKNKQIHTLFHMATGSGKTVIMASLILYLYSKGYRKFIFFVNQINILEKTKDNFINNLSSKYLLNNNLKCLGNSFKIKVVDNFSGALVDNDIEIVFTTTQKLHLDLCTAKENSLTNDDLLNNKIVFIADESHHINADTKIKTTEAGKSNDSSWESSVLKAFESNKASVLLEFTATADLKNENVIKKYIDKIIYSYPLVDFRKSGYTKDFKNFASDLLLWERSLIAMVLSEYRRFIFADLKINIKPVVLFKSQKIKESLDFYGEFFERLSKLNVDEFLNLYILNNDVLNKALNYFKQKDDTFVFLEQTIKNSFAKDKSIIMNGASDDNQENQILINSLEDDSNNIRFIFAVDMLNEGWDVLNLFDIVRLYDTRQVGGNSKKVSAYTIKEAQLIGRGARYCPFSINNKDSHKRKYDDDLENQNRILETMFFHSKNDSRYISELRQALIQIGLQDDKPIELVYRLKKSFKESYIYKSGYIFSNVRIAKNITSIDGMESHIKNKCYRYIVPANQVKIVSLFDDNNQDECKAITSTSKVFAFNQLPYNILRGASDMFLQCRFDIVKQYYPNVTSLREFLTANSYLGNSRIEVVYTDEIKSIDLFNACKNAFAIISSYITSLQYKYNGSIEFSAKLVKDVVKDKKIYLSAIDASGGRGDSQINCVDEKLKLDLSKFDWYVFDDNYGTCEEKLFIKYFYTDVKPKLEAKGLDFYLIRNERFADLAIYDFDSGERFEPDFVLLLCKNNAPIKTQLQVYIEVKGDHLLAVDKWKEDFLKQIANKYKINCLQYGDFKIIGMPFFNHNFKIDEFTQAVDALLAIL